MKKLLLIFSSFSIFSFPVLVTACEAIETFPSKNFSTTTNVINKFFSEEINKIKPYNFKYLQLINNSWEHIGFESNLSTHKANNVIFDSSNLTIEEKSFVDILSSLYNPIIMDDEINFTGLTFAIENIFLNSITLNKEFESVAQSEIAITIKKGWKISGKLLLTLETSSNDLIPKEETFQFINKIIESLKFNFKIQENYEFEETEEIADDYDFYITGNIDSIIFDSFREELLKKQFILNGLNLKNSDIQYEEIESNGEDLIKTITIAGIKYRFV
ncbi:hypothetical protein [Spiroplasma taiwanense]|uniref:Lipoprotein n=1 Tax=Spiroplasma taiwanense CT-1 TaxID=1276220 RepID=S5LTV0_9MOLU|nr:hypothetical protein [Spiroplasma taiwanense]AGR41144.1 hypothetical protein STAIW_v1c05110 [Spiroplasma taiwanense CT-1]